MFMLDEKIVAVPKYFFVGRKVKSIGDKFRAGFQKERTKRYMDLLSDGMNCAGPRMKRNLHHAKKYSDHRNTERVCHNSRYGNSTKPRSARQKRFVGKMLCEKLAQKACTVTKDLCKGKQDDPKIGKTSNMCPYYKKDFCWLCRHREPFIDQGCSWMLAWLCLRVWFCLEYP